MTRYSGILLSSILISVVSHAAAQSRPVTSIDRRVETMNRQTREYERDNMGPDRKKAKQDAAVRTREIRLEIEEDLKGLQAAYNAIVLALQDEVLEPEFAGQTARTIEKHSERLKNNLALPAVEDLSEAKAPVQIPDQVRPVLKALGKAVYDFITNPIFEGTIALDVKESTRASRDLDTLIALSQAIASR